MSQQPQGPGWWRAADGRWYPPQPTSQPYPPQPYPPQQYPQFAAGPPPYTPPPPKRGNRGCLIAVVVVAVLVVAGMGLGAYLLFRVGSAVSDVATSGKDVQCPAAAQVSQIVGSPVTLAGSASVVIAAGCTYTAVDRDQGVDVQITVGPALIADDEFRSLEGDAANEGVTAVPIPVGSRAEAFGGQRRSGAIAVDGGRLVEVEVFGANDPIGDKQAAAVALLSLMLATN